MNSETVIKLKILEKNLLDLLNKIDLEINQTEIEWINLKSIVEEKYKKDEASEESTEKPVTLESIEWELLDDTAINDENFDFSVNNMSFTDADLDEEYESN